VNLWRLLPQDERYSYIFQGNGQVLDHILVRRADLRPRPADQSFEVPRKTVSPITRETSTAT
jgi:predicted extracellular nuclease